MGRSRPHASFREPWALLCAVALVLGGLLGLQHQAAVRHVRCAAHGELVHAALDGAPRGPSGPAAPQDEHCQAARAVHAPGALSPLAPPSDGAPGAARMPVVAPGRALCCGRGLWRVAPMNSPPPARAHADGERLA